MNLILSSSLNLYSKNSAGEKIAQNFGNENGILDLIEKLTPKQNNFVFIANNESNYDATDAYAKIVFDSFKLTFPFKNYIILDGRTNNKAKGIIETADFVFLCGGHVPTQNHFFKIINLRELIKHTKGLIFGVSAGSINCADIVYAQPELEGESKDPNYKKYIKGLGLTNISILPHFEKRRNLVIDGKNVFKDFSLPDSKKRASIAYSDGAYIYDNGATQKMFGKAYLFDNGTFHQISEENSVTDITELVKEKFCQNHYKLIQN